jgi:hypothetical protein
MSVFIEISCRKWQWGISRFFSLIILRKLPAMPVSYYLTAGKDRKGVFYENM